MIHGKTPNHRNGRKEGRKKKEERVGEKEGGKEDVPTKIANFVRRASRSDSGYDWS